MSRRNQLVIPLNLEKIVEVSASVRTLDEICESLDYTKLYNVYQRKTATGKADPVSLFKVLVYGYMTGRYSSRKIEEACKTDINFMWLLNEAEAPDHNTINRFRKGRVNEAVEDLFSQLVNKLKNMGEIECKNLFVDGTKIEANANRYSFVWRKTVEKNSEKLEVKIKTLLEDLNERYIREISDIYEAFDFLLKQKEKYNIEFVRGKGKRKTQLQRDFEAVKDSKEKLEKYTEYNSLFAGRNSFSKTDTDATFMHMKEDHMRNGQLKPGYNVQIGVDSEYIVNVGLFSERSDQLTLIPFLKDTEEKTGIRHKEIVADAGYESEENYVYLNKHNQDSYIKPSNYETSKKRKKKPYSTDSFNYNAETDTYTCPENHELKPLYIRNSKTKSGYISEKTIYGTCACDNCPNKKICTKSEKGRTLQRAKLFADFRNKSRENITTPKGIKLRMNRSIQVEGAFGVLKQDYGFRRFLTRGVENVKVEMLLLCFSFNINKLHNKTVKNRRRTYLFEKLIA